MLSSKLVRAKELLVTRNLIAHNPLVLGILNPDGGFTHREAIVSLRDRKRKIELLEMQAFAAECEQLVSELHESVRVVVEDLHGRTGTA